MGIRGQKAAVGSLAFDEFFNDPSVLFSNYAICESDYDL
jgi:hypothetical protein